MLSRKRAHQTPVPKFNLPSQMLATIQCQVPVEVELSTILLHVDRNGSDAVAVQLNASKFTPLDPELKYVLLLPFGAAFVRCIGDPCPTAGKVLGGDGARGHEPNHGKSRGELHQRPLYIDFETS